MQHIHFFLLVFFLMLPEVPTLNELMDEAKTPDIARRLSAVLLSSGEFGRPLDASPGLPPGPRQALARRIYEKRG
ncbi:MAG TPA: hypothetical protein VMO00_18785 [Methylomirabilota bacterium]|nr:hypothetical protein [Methylomirabilota bacterium]